MIDEDAFGLLIAYLDLEHDEYAGTREQFVARHTAFTSLVRERLATDPPALAARALGLGHAVYLELVADDRATDPVAWLRATRDRLSAHAFESAAILTYGASWLDPSSPAVTPTPAHGEGPRGSRRGDAASTDGEGVPGGDITLVQVSLPSEPFRHALAADAAARGDDESPGWGPGLYLSLDAVEALGKKPKNAPTVLRSGGVGFLRAGR
jgi:hypothetical protein